MKHKFRFAGTGGQGLITAAIILANAALLDGKLAVQSQSYGPEARGGSSKAEAIVSDQPIHFNRVVNPDTFLVMSQMAADKYIVDVRDEATVITDKLFVSDLHNFKGRRIDLPITHTAIEKCGKPLFANIVALGALVELTHCVSEKSLEDAVLARVPKGTEEKNKLALQAGRDLILNHQA